MKSVQMLLSIIVVLVLSIIAMSLYGFAMQGRVSKSQQIPVVTDFASCANAGYPIVESYPRQCQSPDGRSFVDTSESVPVPSSTTTDSIPTNIQLQ